MNSLAVKEKPFCLLKPRLSNIVVQYFQQLLHAIRLTNKKMLTKNHLSYSAKRCNIVGLTNVRQQC